MNYIIYVKKVYEMYYKEQFYFMYIFNHKIILLNYMLFTHRFPSYFTARKSAKNLR